MPNLTKVRVISSLTYKTTFLEYRSLMQKKIFVKKWSYSAWILISNGFDAGIEHVDGNMFEDVPKGRDAILVKVIKLVWSLIIS